MATSSAAPAHLIGYTSSGNVIGHRINAEHVQFGPRALRRIRRPGRRRSVQSNVLGRVRWVHEIPHVSPQVLPGRSDQTRCRAIAEIDHDEPPRVTFPAPGDKVLISIISRPSGPFAQLPVSMPEGRVGHGWQEGAIEGEKGFVGWLCGVSAEEHR